MRLSSSNPLSVIFEKEIDGHNTLATHTLFCSSLEAYNELYISEKAQSAEMPCVSG